MTVGNDRPMAGRFVVGLGCERAAPIEDVCALAERALREAGIAPEEVAALASIDMKEGEPAILEAARRLNVPARFFSAGRLEEETPRLKNPSELVFARVGCHGVAEAAALAAAGPAAELVLAKIKSAFATAAIAEME
ncbi:cobalamin biosynthesis protein [Rhizobium sp. RAF56]|uniref:cobalamin biosynthesis protein n=1 Tax=Rhizobium sp. RAF56 TaxID=3233062 RepID=UPI003F94D1DF